MVGGEEEGDGAGDFVGLAEASEGVHGFGEFAGLFVFGDGGGEGGVGEAGGDAVDAELAFGVGGGGGAGEADEARFGGGDRFVVGEAFFGSDGGDKDEGAAGFAHGAGEGLEEVEGGVEVGVEGVIPIIEGGEMGGFEENGADAVGGGFE